jgi:hypothetical protein
MNTEKIEKLKKGLTNSQIPESLREKIRQQISRLEAEDKANEPAPKEEAMPKKEVTPKVAKAPTVRKPTVRKSTVRKPRAKKVVEPKTTTTGKTTAMSLAKEIRKDGEKWTDAVKRAGMQMKKGTTEVKKSTKTEMQKLLALVKRRKELKGISGTNIKRDSQRKAKPRGARTVTNSGQTSNKYGTYDNKLGRKYTENRDNRTDRLAPKYPKNSPLLENGGGVDETKYIPHYAPQASGFGKIYSSELNDGNQYTYGQGSNKNYGKSDDNRGYLYKENGIYFVNGFKNGKHFSETFEKFTDAKKFYLDKKTKSYELGGTVVTDLAGNTSGGDLGLNAGMSLSGFSNTSYTGLVGETGAMSSGEMFKLGGKLEGKKNQINMLFKNQGIKEVIRKEHVDSIRKIIEEDGLSTKGISDDEILMIEKEIIKELSKGKMELGGGLPSGSEQHYVNYYLGSGTAQGIYKDGGSVESVPRKEYIEFVDYVNEFYGKDGIYADQLNGGFTKSQIKVAVVKYFSTFDKNRTWGGGDSLDRERVREILDPSYKMEHGGSMHDYKKMEDNYANGGFMDNVYATGGGVRNSILLYEGQSLLLQSVPSPKEKRFLNKEIVVEKIYGNKIVESFLRETGEKVPFVIDPYEYKMEQYAKGGGIRIKNGQTYDYGRVWTNDHNQFDKGAEHEVNYRK